MPTAMTMQRMTAARTDTRDYDQGRNGDGDDDNAADDDVDDARNADDEEVVPISYDARNMRRATRMGGAIKRTTRSRTHASNGEHGCDGHRCFSLILRALEV